MYDAGFENAMILGGVHAPGMTPYELAWLAKFPHLQLDKAKVDSDIVKNIQTLQLEGSVENAKEGMALATSMQEDLVMDGQCLKP